MKADRLVAVLLLLQRHERVTAAQVATELEVSERTARRDLEALALSGVPVYPERGRHGGWRLLGGARTDLSGLTAPEARALFLVAGPAASSSPQLRAALRKLVRALPEPMRASAEMAAGSVVQDPVGWGRTGNPPQPELLDDVQTAVSSGERIRLGYRDRAGAPSCREVDPLGTARKGTVWYLLADTDAGLRTFRVSRITSVEPTGAAVRRPPDFDLDEAWRQVVDRVDDLRSPAEVWGSADAAIVPVLRWIFGRRLTVGETAGDGRFAIRVRGESVHVLCAQVAGLGTSVRIEGPAEALERLAAIGRDLVAAYVEPDRAHV